MTPLGSPPPGDCVVTVVLLVIDGVLAAAMSLLGMFLGMYLGCGDSEVCYVVQGALVWTAVLLPWLLFAAAIVVSWSLSRIQKPALWVPAVAAALIVGVFLACERGIRWGTDALGFYL